MNEGSSGELTNTFNFKAVHLHLDAQSAISTVFPLVHENSIDLAGLRTTCLTRMPEMDIHC